MDMKRRSAWIAPRIDQGRSSAALHETERGQQLAPLLLDEPGRRRLVQAVEQAALRLGEEAALVGGGTTRHGAMVAHAWPRRTGCTLA
jgi:hypothetical protein